MLISTNKGYDDSGTGLPPDLTGDSGTAAGTKSQKPTAVKGREMNRLRQGSGHPSDPTRGSTTAGTKPQQPTASKRQEIKRLEQDSTLETKKILALT